MALITPIKTPLVVKKMFPNYIWDIASTSKTIYLTFDDGPTPEITNWTLQTLEKFNAKATFFCIGNNVDKHPDIFQNIVKAGHAIGNHTHNHIKGWKTKAEAYIENIELCESEFKNQIPNNQSLTTNLFRPPYGQISPKQGKLLRSKGYKIIMWDILSFDWDANVSKETCLDNVIKKTSDGSVVVFHDSIKASENMQYVLPKVLEYFNEKGYCFKALNWTV
ncbi:polysaccharide deacetylase family protein [Thalassobellus sediminis]|uniref:polysaccharide deacetylase family protein n=1 Tax=Thalassobellus sediminis TaxID=3367753 RepID=UPI0037B5E5B3